MTVPETAPAPAAPLALPERPRERLGPWIALIVAAAVVGVGMLGTATAIGWSYLETQRWLAQERTVSAVEQGVVDDAVAAAADTAAQIEAGRTALTDAQEIWDAGQAAMQSRETDDTAPAIESPNPGGDRIPGYEDRMRALLDEIGATDVQVIFDASGQNCGYAGGGADGSLVAGGCYDSRYPDWLFLAWDRGLSAQFVWPIFVHEAMHWYQWEHYLPLFEVASRLGISDDAYRDQLESDASCRAVYEHGIPRSAYDNSSAPCDVDGWYEGWLVDQLAALGVPTTAPDPESYEVQAVMRP
jgi:hypothetical protein